MKTYEPDDEVIGMWFLREGRTCIVRPLDDDPTLPLPEPSIPVTWNLPPAARAPSRRERDVRLQSLSLLLAGALAGLVYALVILLLWRALGN